MYSQLGDVILTGDFNSRIGHRSDLVDNLNLDTNVDMPEPDLSTDILQKRLSADMKTNSFGHKLLTICKENSVFIANGRLEPGLNTCYNLCRNTVGASTVDYVIVNYNMYSRISSMNVLDLTEFSDHCPIDFTLLCDKCLSTNHGHSFIKIDWKQNNVDFLNHTLEDKRLVFDEITNKLLSDLLITV